MRATFTGRQTHSVRHSQNTKMLSYAKRCCFPNRPMEPREWACLQSQGAWTGSLCQSPPALLSGSVTSLLQLVHAQPEGYLGGPHHSPGSKARTTQLIRKSPKTEKNFRRPGGLKVDANANVLPPTTMSCLLFFFMGGGYLQRSYEQLFLWFF